MNTAPIKVQEQLVFVNDANLYVEVTGSGDALVLLHGGGGDLRYWDEQFFEFASDYQVIRYDLRGFGKSDLPDEGKPYSHEDDLYELLKVLNVEKAHIAGFSLGCKLAFDAYTRYPQIFKSIIAVGPYVTGYESDAASDLFDAFYGCVPAFEKSGQTGAAEYFVSIPAFKPEHVHDSIKQKLLEICCDHSWWWTTREDPVTTVEPLAVDVVEKVDVPVLIITAEFDIDVCREVADLLRRRLKVSELVDYSDASHFMLMEKPKEFNRDMLAFLRDKTN